MTNKECEDCKHYKHDHRGYLCHFASPFLAKPSTQRGKPRGGSLNCGIEGYNFEPEFNTPPPTGRGEGGEA